MWTFITVISASTGRNDFIFDIWERVEVFLTRLSMQHLVYIDFTCGNKTFKKGTDILIILVRLAALHIVLEGPKRWQYQSSRLKHKNGWQMCKLNFIISFSFWQWKTSTFFKCLITTDILASTGRNDLIFDIWLLHGELYHVSPFQIYRTSTSCLPHYLEFFMFAVMKTFVTDISASTGRNDFIFDIWLLHGDLIQLLTMKNKYLF
jgi:hypothetical protein